MDYNKVVSTTLLYRLQLAVSLSIKGLIDIELSARRGDHNKLLRRAPRSKASLLLSFSKL